MKKHILTGILLSLLAISSPLYASETVVVGGGGEAVSGEDITPNSITVGAGTVGAPSVAIGLTGDSGLYEISDDSIGFSTNGTIRWAVTGNSMAAGNSGGWNLNNAAASATIPVFALKNDANTGMGRSGADQLALISGAVNAVTYIENGGILALSQITAGITADTGSSQGDGPITSSINQYSVVANVGDAGTMPDAVAGYLVEIYNDGANAMDVFPASGDNLGAGVDTAVSLAAGANITYRAIDATNWKTRT